MAAKITPINVRLPDEHGVRFESLRREFPGLPSSVVLRALLISQLARPLPEQVDIVIAALRKQKPVANAGAM